MTDVQKTLETPQSPANFVPPILQVPVPLFQTALRGPFCRYLKGDTGLVAPAILPQSQQTADVGSAGCVPENCAPVYPQQFIRDFGMYSAKDIECIH